MAVPRFYDIRQVMFQHAVCLWAKTSRDKKAIKSIFLQDTKSVFFFHSLSLFATVWGNRINIRDGKRKPWRQLRLKTAEIFFSFCQPCNLQCNCQLPFSLHQRKKSFSPDLDQNQDVSLSISIFGDFVLFLSHCAIFGNCSIFCVAGSHSIESS